MNNRWWWQGEVVPATKTKPRRNMLFDVVELAGEGERLPANRLGPTIGVRDVSRWIDHLEGLPQR